MTGPKIFVKEFSAIAVTRSAKKQSLVREQKERREYSPGADFYKFLRDCIQDVHKKNISLDHLETAIEKTSDRTRKKYYRMMIDQYTAWVDGRELGYFKPPRDSLRISNSEIVVNPELGLQVDGQNVIYKLYFGKDSMSEARANFILAIMLQLWPRRRCRVLDIKGAVEFEFSGNMSHFSRAIRDEVSAIETIWDSV